MKNIITDKLGEAQKAGDKSRILTLRLIIAAIKDKEIASRSNGEKDEIEEEHKKFKRKKRNIAYKKRATREEKTETYTKIMLLIKLRVL